MCRDSWRSLISHHQMGEGLPDIQQELTEEVKAFSCSFCLSLPSNDVLPMAETLVSCPHCLHFITRGKQS